MQILSSTVSVLDHAIRFWSNQSNITLTKQCRWGKDTILQYDIGWWSSGSVSVESCEEFIANLKIASDLAEEVNRFRYEVVSIDSLQGPELPVFVREKKISLERSVTEALFCSLAGGRVSAISHWLEAQRIS